MRLQLALNARNIEEAISYYAKLFNTQPLKFNYFFAAVRNNNIVSGNK